MRLIEIALSALNLEEMRQFYCSILGFRDVEPGWTERLVVEAGSTRLIFLPGPAGWQGRYHFAFDVPSGRFEAALSWLRQRRGLVTDNAGKDRFHSESWDADNVYFYDPQGNILELIVRHELDPQAAAGRTPADDEARRLADRPFSAAEIVAVTEIGIAAGSVADAVAQLTQQLPGVTEYKGPGSDTFAPVGDAHGLLIVVRRGRIWFPDTGITAEPLPLDLLLELENGARYRLKSPPFPFEISPM